MIQYMTRVISILMLFLFMSCNSTISKISGTYVAQNFVTNIDSLILKKNGTYRRVIYNNKKKILFENTSKWIYNDSKIIFSDFLINLDDLKYSNENVKYDNILITNYSSVENIFFSTKIVIDNDLNYYYEKIED